MTNEKLNTLAKAKEDYLFALQNLNNVKQTVRPLDDELADLIDRLRTEHRAKYAPTYDTLEASQAAFSDAESSLREQTVAAYRPGGEKKFDEHLSVRVTKKLKYDPTKAVEWAEANAPVLIVKQVDKKAFEAMPTVHALEFVTVEEAVSAVISGLPKPE